MQFFPFRILMTEAYVNNRDLMEYYGKMEEPGLGSISHMPINFNLIFENSTNSMAKKVYIYVHTYRY